MTLSVDPPLLKLVGEPILRFLRAVGGRALLGLIGWVELCSLPVTQYVKISPLPLMSVIPRGSRV